MKTMVLATVLALSGVLRAQVGEKADTISIPVYSGVTVLHHCQAVEELPDALKVTHDDGISTVALKFLPVKWQKAIQAKKDAAAAVRQKELAQREEENRQLERELASASTAQSDDGKVGNAKTAPTAPSAAPYASSTESGELAHRTNVPPPPLPPGHAPGIHGVTVIPSNDAHIHYTNTATSSQEGSITSQTTSIDSISAIKHPSFKIKRAREPVMLDQP